jgi:hypothetical protein
MPLRIQETETTTVREAIERIDRAIAELQLQRKALSELDARTKEVTPK